MSPEKTNACKLFNLSSSQHSGFPCSKCKLDLACRSRIPEDVSNIFRWTSPSIGMKLSLKLYLAFLVCLSLVGFNHVTELPYCASPVISDAVVPGTKLYTHASSKRLYKKSTNFFIFWSNRILGAPDSACFCETNLSSKWNQNHCHPDAGDWDEDTHDEAGHDVWKILVVEEKCREIRSGQETKSPQPGKDSTFNWKYFCSLL